MVVNGITFTSRRSKRLLLLLTAFLLILAAGLSTAAWLFPYPLPVGEVTESFPRPVMTQASGPPLRVEDFATLWTLDLRAPLYDLAPQEIQIVEYIPPPLQIRLLGIILEEPKAQAIVLDSQGRTVFKHVGGIVEEATILSIDADHITLSYHNQEVTLALDSN